LYHLATFLNIGLPSQLGKGWKTPCVFTQFSVTPTCQQTQLCPAKTAVVIALLFMIHLMLTLPASQNWCFFVMNCTRNSISPAERHSPSRFANLL